METRTQTQAVLVHVSGRVQGVGFRWFVQTLAEKLGIKGWVRNTPEGTVEAYGEGPAEALKVWLGELQKGPSLSHVEDLQSQWQAAPTGLSNFEIRG